MMVAKTTFELKTHSLKFAELVISCLCATRESGVRGQLHSGYVALARMNAEI